MGKLRSMEALFAGRHFDCVVIILCVRWYLRFKLSYRDVVEMMGERGLVLQLPRSARLPVVLNAQRSLDSNRSIGLTLR